MAEASGLEEDAHGRRLHRHLTQTSTAWDEGGRDEGDLYRGARLTTVLDWAATQDRDLNDLERDFVARSRALSEGQAVEAAHEPVAADFSLASRVSSYSHRSSAAWRFGSVMKLERPPRSPMPDTSLPARSSRKTTSCRCFSHVRPSTSTTLPRRGALLATFNAHPRSWRGCTRQAARRHSGTNRSGSRSRWTEHGCHRRLGTSYRVLRHGASPDRSVHRRCGNAAWDLQPRWGDARDRDR